MLQVAGPSGGPGDEDSSRISPWELFNAGLDADEVLEEAQSLPQDARSRMLAAVRRAGREPRFELFLETPSPTIFHSASTAAGDADARSASSITYLLERPCFRGLWGFVRCCTLLPEAAAGAACPLQIFQHVRSAVPVSY